MAQQYVCTRCQWSCQEPVKSLWLSPPSARPTQMAASWPPVLEAGLERHRVEVLSAQHLFFRAPFSCFVPLG